MSKDNDVNELLNFIRQRSHMSYSDKRITTLKNIIAENKEQVTLINKLEKIIKHGLNEYLTISVNHKNIEMLLEYLGMISDERGDTCPWLIGHFETCKKLVVENGKLKYDVTRHIKSTCLLHSEKDQLYTDNHHLEVMNEYHKGKLKEIHKLLINNKMFRHDSILKATEIAKGEDNE